MKKKIWWWLRLWASLLPFFQRSCFWHTWPFQAGLFCRFLRKLFRCRSRLGNSLEVYWKSLLIENICRYPFSIERPFVFWSVYVYQIYGISTSACFNSSSDTLGSALIAHINSQVRRLGIQLAKVRSDFSEERCLMKCLSSDWTWTRNCKTKTGRNPWKYESGGLSARPANDWNNCKDKWDQTPERWQLRRNCKMRHVPRSTCQVLAGQFLIDRR